MDPEQRKKQVDIALRGIAFLVAIAVTLVAAFGGLGSWVDAQQAALNDGYFYPKLTIALLLVVVGGPTFFVVYLPLRKLWLPRLLAKIDEQSKAP